MALQVSRVLLKKRKKITKRERVDENESGLIKGKTDTLVPSEVQKEKKKTKNEKAFMHGQVKKKIF